LRRFTGVLVAVVGIAGSGLVLQPILGQSTAVKDGPHEVLRFENGRFQTQGDDGWTDITDITIYCLDCHGDGEPGGSDQIDTLAPESSHELGGLGRSHPVDVKYPSGANGYRPIGDLGGKITLVNGRVTCLTCHSASSDRSLLLPTKAGELCIACHEM
jgi:predicted CXXCH cytochrome family protein